MSADILFINARKNFHSHLAEQVLFVDSDGVPSNADSKNPASVKIAQILGKQIGPLQCRTKLKGQVAGNIFEQLCADFVESTFSRLNHLRPGTWTVSKGFGKSILGISQFEQYEHLAALAVAARANAQLAAALGNDYLIKPDVVIARYPEDDTIVNSRESLVDEHIANLTSIRKINNTLPLLHANISCKWTLRSDRSQNARSEGLNLVRNRKGRLPHIAVVTGEPLPSRIASIALGTGDIDCVYHFALPELIHAVTTLELDDSREMLQTMIDGKRLRDIADLPLDLII
ncbi:NgoMIV family type II restriction endonuclease [Fundidesulfovibrio agrisoli]|uniref:NgoMIV family type II restriction endonuclease n=1 Tax=Fundidesulfovibrio agrisoli TaxID=2922717 RepID=UPI001FAE3547|nr:NgoMIV family type II restriction endonuclease [Fundidesulfovibrio agrisoli]